MNEQQIFEINQNALQNIGRSNNFNNYKPMTTPNGAGMSSLVNTPGSQKLFAFGESSSGDLQKMFRKHGGPNESKPHISHRPPKPGQNNQENLMRDGQDVKRNFLNRINNNKSGSESEDSVGNSPVKESVNHHPNKIMPSIVRRAPATLLNMEEPQVKPRAGMIQPTVNPRGFNDRSALMPKVNPKH
jgi:hypothetical protein